MKTEKDIIKEIESKIEQTKKDNKRHIYLMSVEVCPNFNSEILKNHFLNYGIEMRRCPRGFWDIIITL